MNRLIFLLFFAISGSLLAQTGTLQGTIIDQEGEPLPYATVLVFKGDYFVNGARTYEGGTYKVFSLEAGLYEVKVKFLNSEQQVEGVSIVSDEITFLDVSMEIIHEIRCCGMIVPFQPPLFEKDPEPSGAVYSNKDYLWHSSYIPRRP